MQIFQNLCKFNKILPRYDSRSKDYSYAIYGQVAGFQKEYNTDRPLLDDVQNSGDIRCACYSVCDVAEDKEGIEYNIQDLFERVPSTDKGTDPIRVIKEAIKMGLMPIGGSLRFKPFISYFEAHTGRFDAFDNCRSALSLCQYPLVAWSPWFGNFLSGLLPKGQGLIGYHAWTIEGWKQMNGEPVLIIEAWVGRKMYFNRETFNWLSSQYGFGTAVLSTIEIDAKRKKTILETLRDALINLVILYKQLIAKKSVGNIPNLYDVAYSLLGKRLTLNLDIPKEYGCAQAMSYVLKRYGANIPKKGISGTYTLYEWLKENAFEIQNPEVGCILIYPTGTGNFNGHVFVVGKHSLMSNNSRTGLWDWHWTLDEAKQYYQIKGGMKPHYFII